jgi:hypothetical protein
MNVCPYCGQSILDEHLKNLLSSLRETMTKLQDYPEQLSDWLLSNYNFIKTDSPNLTNYLSKETLKEFARIENDKDFQSRKDNHKFTVKVKTENGEEDVSVEKIQSDEKTGDFFARAQDRKRGDPVNVLNSIAEKTSKLKTYAAQIKKAGSQAIVGEDGASMDLSAEMLNSADEASIAEYQSLMSAEGDVFSSIQGNDYDDDVPQFVINANNALASKNGNQSTANAKDLEALRNLHAKSHGGVSSGRGSFSR